MKIKTNELTGAALDWAVAKCAGIELYPGPRDRNPAYKANWVRRKHGDLFQPSTDWAQAGPIIEREEIRLDPPSGTGWWMAHKNGHLLHGPTPLIAAMRCYVAYKLGDEVEVPDELI
jgi:hypothetical protein